MDERGAAAAKFPLTKPAASEALALAAVVRRLSVCRSLQEVIETVTPAARQLLDADGVTFVLRDGDLCHYADEDAIAPLWKGKRFPMSACISGWCMAERQTAVIADIYQDPRIPHDAYRPTFVRSLAMVPVRQDDPVAAMGAYWRQGHAVAPGEVQLLQAIANAAGLAIANVELSAERENAGKAGRELSHRMGNMLAVVEALARRTLRRTAEPEAFAEAFIGRLQALSRAQGVLAEPAKCGVTIAALVKEQVLLGDDGSPILCEGPDVALAAEETLDLALALHELGTNARKYGALSSDSGRVTITWRVEPESSGRLATLSWVEEGGPPVQPPEDRGFGSALLRQAFKRNGGSAQLRFEKKGVHCHMKIPLLWRPLRDG